MRDSARERRNELLDIAGTPVLESMAVESGCSRLGLGLFTGSNK